MYKLRTYQKEAVESAISHFQKSRKPAVIVLPTGAGKSLVIAELARIARGRVLVLAHVKELVEQNYKKYTSFGLEAGIYSAGLGKKEIEGKVIFGSIQSVARATEEMFQDFSIVIIDECHRISDENSTQYQDVINLLRKNNEQICILGLTATPYRLGLGWIYEVSSKGEIKSERERFFKNCIYELPLSYMISNHYLTPPIKVDIPVTCYDFSELTEKGRMYTQSEIDQLLTNQKRLTPLIVKNIIDITEKFDRKGVMIFSSTVKHAQEIMLHLPADESELIIGETETQSRDEIIDKFKSKKIKYLVNVSVLTTGFDAPHVDVIAILRPTESNSLYQQIVGRGLRLEEGKKDCFILDYTGMGHDIFRPEIADKRPHKDTVPVKIECPKCQFINDFWGYQNLEGEVIEHFGKKCRGSTINQKTNSITPCQYLFRFKLCHQCSYENDISAKECHRCKAVLIDADSKLKQAKLSKENHILTPEKMTLEKKEDKTGREYLEIRYYDTDAQYLSEAYFFNYPSSIMKFRINFLRWHQKIPEAHFDFNSIEDVQGQLKKLRMPAFLIARKQDKFWKITEKIFSEELN
jgi:DNA repair protein RadD